MKILRGHVSPDSAYVVDDYPYGFRLRCKIRYWLEKADKGAKKGQYRFMSQTTNPKKPGEVWNKPKASTYLAFAILTLDESNGYVNWDGLHECFWPEAYARFVVRINIGQLDSTEKFILEYLVKEARKLSPKSWGEMDKLVEDIRKCWPNYAADYPDRKLAIKGSVEAMRDGNPVYMTEYEAAYNFVTTVDSDKPMPGEGLPQMAVNSPSFIS